MLGDGLVVSVGNTLWACELSKKATLVLRTLAGGYVFSEVAGKPECESCNDWGERVWLSGPCVLCNLYSVISSQI